MLNNKLDLTFKTKKIILILKLTKEELKLQRKLEKLRKEKIHLMTILATVMKKMKLQKEEADWQKKKRKLEMKQKSKPKRKLIDLELSFKVRKLKQRLRKSKKHKRQKKRSQTITPILQLNTMIVVNKVNIKVKINQIKQMWKNKNLKINIKSKKHK